jgi:phage baseplate assembly protein W
MAIVLGQKLVKDTEKYNDYAIGITLPIQIGNTAFNQSFTTIEQTKSNIKNLLLTKKYERLMQPNLGSGMQELLFEMNDEDLAQKIEDTINSSMETWLPFVTI